MEMGDHGRRFLIEEVNKYDLGYLIFVKKLTTKPYLQNNLHFSYMNRGRKGHSSEARSIILGSREKASILI